MELLRLARSKGAAVALDFLIWGSGHAYLGFRKAAGLPWIIWTMAFGVYALISAGTEASGSFYYVDYSEYLPTLAYNTGAAIAFVAIPFLLIGGLMVLDLMRKGGLQMPGRTAAITGQPQPQPMQQAVQSMGTPRAFCPRCGTAVTGADAFCPSCGNKLEVSVPVTPQPVATGGARTCNNCGTANPGGYLFCKRCGARLA